jgi:PTH1 family peptidyl-tRNA hydrolase
VIIAGLGNPGDGYRETRHNIGFKVVDLIAERWGRPLFKQKFSSEIALLNTPEGKRVYLQKPQTFMNLSGDAVQPAAAYFKVPPAQVLVIHDELDLPLGRLQLKKGGGSGGHNGLKSLTARQGTADYLRLRVGIGRPSADFRGDTAAFLLQAFPHSEFDAVEKLISSAGDAVELVLEKDLPTAMNRVNRRK